MKKLIIAGAALSMAALPFVGVSATEVKDTLTLTIGKGCTMTTVDNNNSGVTGKYDFGLVATGGSAVLGGAEGIQGTDMIISCNSANGWELSVAAEAMEFTNTEGTKTIPFGAFVESGSDSVWSMQLNSDASGVTIASPWNAFGSTKANGVAASGNYVANGKITPRYKAYVAEGQADGTYTGTVTYTFTDKGNE